MKSEDQMGKILNPSRSQSSKVIPFFQNANYYFTKGLKAYRKQDLLKAKKYLYKAIQLEPREAVFLCQLAIVLTELGEYIQSNKLLFTLIKEIDPEMYECNYFIANNFAHLGLFREAKKYAELYRKHEPDGEFSEDNINLLDVISIDIEEDEESDFQDDLLIVNHENARVYIEEGKLEDAIQLLHQITNQYPEFWPAYNNLALAYFYAGNVHEAMNVIDYILEKNQGNLHALCNKVLFYYHAHNDEKVSELIAHLEKVHPMTIEHRYKLGATFCLVGEYPLAYKWLMLLYKKGFTGEPAFYHWLAYAAYFTGRITFAKNMWKRWLELNPDNAGLEPWRESDLIKEAEGLITTLLKSSVEHEKMFGLYLLSLQSYEKQIAFKQQNELSEIEREFFTYLTNRKNDKQFPRYFEKCYNITYLLLAKNRNIIEKKDLFITWFYIFLKVIKSKEIEIDNTSAWAAAVEYIWLKKQNPKTTQKGLAKRYLISSSTVGKYVKIVDSFLK